MISCKGLKGQKRYFLTETNRKGRFISASCQSIADNENAASMSVLKQNGSELHKTVLWRAIKSEKPVCDFNFCFAFRFENMQPASLRERRIEVQKNMNWCLTKSFDFLKRKLTVENDFDLLVSRATPAVGDRTKLPQQGLWLM